MGQPSQRPAFGYLLDAIWTARTDAELRRFGALARAHYRGEARQALERLIEDRGRRLHLLVPGDVRTRRVPEGPPPRVASGNG